MTTALLKHLLFLDENKVLRFLRDTLRSLGYTTHSNGHDYLVCIPPPGPRTPIALVAHIDTVPRAGVDLARSGVFLRNNLGVLGADDRAGVFALLELARSCKQKPILIFTNGEELGGVGARVLTGDGILQKYANHISLFIELDREGADEFVYYSCELPLPIARWAQSYGFRKANGAYSDVAEFTKVTAIPHVNLSTGYYNRHTPQERLDLSVLEMTIFRVRAMIEDEQVPRGLNVNDPHCLASNIPRKRRTPIRQHSPTPVVNLPAVAGVHGR